MRKERIVALVQKEDALFGSKNGKKKSVEKGFRVFLEACGKSSEFRVFEMVKEGRKEFVCT